MSDINQAIPSESAKLPRVSIGMPVFNGDKFIREALDSLLAQTFTDFELIISDNASTDRTEAICREYAERDKRIRYVRQAENLGPAANFRFVLDEAVGEYFMWAAADDLNGFIFRGSSGEFVSEVDAGLKQLTHRCGGRSGLLRFPASADPRRGPPASPRAVVAWLPDRHRPDREQIRVCAPCRRVPDGRRRSPRHRAAAGASLSRGVPVSRHSGAPALRCPGAAGPASHGRIPRWWRTEARPSVPGSMATRAIRSGSAGSGLPSGQRRGGRGAPPPRGAARPACDDRATPRPARSPRRPRRRTSTTTSVSGGQGQGKAQGRVRPSRMFRARMIQPAATSLAATRSSPENHRCAGPWSSLRAPCGTG